MISNANAVLRYTYDAAGRLLSETQELESGSYTVTYGWDPDGRPSALGYPSG